MVGVQEDIRSPWLRLTSADHLFALVTVVFPEWGVTWWWKPTTGLAERSVRRIARMYSVKWKRVHIVKKAVYIAIGINMDGKKDVLGMWGGENESAKFWAGVLNSMRNRGVDDILIACTGRLLQSSSDVCCLRWLHRCISGVWLNKVTQIRYRCGRSLEVVQNTSRFHPQIQPTTMFCNKYE